jgi:filamentous hemagglutinin family protein
MKSKTLLSLLAFTVAFLNAEMASAQTYQPSDRPPVADNTQIGTQVSGNGNNFNITGGLSRGQTLFHSFKDFSIPTGGAANFNNPAGTRDIISRVTGNLFSDINGTLNSNGANFLLINPNGVVFGPNARLNVGKAFAASTASGVDLIDGQGRQITFGTNPNGDAPLLTINPNVFFNVSKLTMGANVPNNPGIVNYGTLQTTNPNQYIGLIGGNVTLNGGKIIAPGGKVELAGLSQAGGIGFSFDKGVQFPANVGRGDVVMVTNGTSPSVIDVLSAGGGGSVNIFAKDIILRGTGTNIITGISAGASSPNAIAGDIKVDATGNIGLSEADIFNQVLDGRVGNAGNIEINTRNLFLTNGGVLTSSSFGTGNAGNVKITASGDVFFDGTINQGNKDTTITGASSTLELKGMGKGGDVEINTRNLSLINGAQIQSLTRGKGDAGNVKITASGDISVDGTPNKNGLGSAVFSTVEQTGEGKGRDVDIINTRNLYLTNGGRLTSSTNGKGDAGSVNITASGDISVTNGGQIQAFTFGTGNAGNVNIKTTSGDITFDNAYAFSTVEPLSKEFSTVEQGKVRQGGNIKIDTRNLYLKNGGQIQASTRGKGNAGGVNINAPGGDISVDGFNKNNISRSTIVSTVEQGADGKGGNIDVQTRNLTLKNGAQLSTSTSSKGSAGYITVSATDKIDIDGLNQEFADTIGESPRSGVFSLVGKKGIGQGGSIEIKTPKLDVKNGGAIAAASAGNGNAGSVKIKDADRISFDGFKNDKSGFLSASGAFSTIEDAGIGKGGDVEIINTRDLFLTNGGELTSSTFGNGNAGSVKIKDTDRISFDGTNGKNSSGAFSTVEQTGKGKGGDVEIINTRDLFLTNGGVLNSTNYGIGDAGSVKIKDTDRISFDGKNGNNSSGAFSVVAQTGKGKGGDVEIINTRDLFLTNGGVLNTGNFGTGAAGNAAGNIVVLNTNTITLNNGGIGSQSNSSTGGDINVTTKDYLLLRNTSRIAADSSSDVKPNGNGGNITINSPLIVALPGNNDISANAKAGNGGRVNITSQGLFGIKYRPKGQESDGTNDITANSILGESGTVNISTLGTDPGKDSTVLPTVPTDASNQIAQTCNASRENKFIIAGRGGLPPNANDPLTSDVVWQDARATNSQPTANSTTNDRNKLPPPAVGLVLDGKGKAFLIAAGSEGQPTKTNVVCPSGVRK